MGCNRINSSTIRIVSDWLLIKMEVDESVSVSKNKENNVQNSESEADILRKKLQADEKISLDELRDFSNAKNVHPENLKLFEGAILAAEKILTLINLLDLNKTRTRTRHMSPKKFKISLEELGSLSAEIERQVVHIPQGQCVHDLYATATSIQSKIDEFLSEPLDKIESVRGMVDLLEEIDSLDVTLKKSTDLMDKIKKVKWFKKSLIVGKYEDDIDERDIQDFSIPLEKEDFRKFLEEGKQLECCGLRKNLQEMENLWLRYVFYQLVI